MCTPSRAAFLTGRYPIRSGMAPRGTIRVNYFTSSVSGLPPNEITIADIAKERGYYTGFIGKWHLGLNCEHFDDNCHHPLNQGFDYYYGFPLTNYRDLGPDGGTMLQTRMPNYKSLLLGIFLAGALFALTLKRLGIIGAPGVVILLLLASVPAALTYFLFLFHGKMNGIVMRNYEVVEQPVKLDSMTQRLVREGNDFLQVRSEDRNPFLLIMSWIQVHTALHATSPFKGRSAHGRYGYEVEEMDWSVGEILNSLDKLGLTDNTFVYFTSDHGGHLETRGVRGDVEGGWNGIYRGGKGQGAMDGGIRVPTVARWPGVIQPGSIIDLPTSLMDVFPTVTSIIHGQLPSDRIIDGVDIGDILRGDAVEVPHDFLVHYCADQIHAARYTTGDGSDVYKVFYGTPKWLPGTQGCGYMCQCHDEKVDWHDPPLMYNIAKDPSETTPLDVTEPKYKDILARIERRLSEHRNSILPVENQFQHKYLLPRPWLQSCCNWPSCQCEEQV